MSDDFPDRRDRLFGREPDIKLLIERAQRPGITALVARPMMGKTWTLQEVARRLMADGRFLVGYHESKGSETSHLLYAVANLYSRWLADSTMRGQAMSLWQRHKANVVPRVGQMVGALLEKVAGPLLPDGIAGAVRSAFDGLAETQRDLIQGGLQLAPLPYDQAQSLVSLVAKLSERKVVLILDAWEVAKSLRLEKETLESMLKHREEWTSTHVLVAIRDPQQVVAGSDGSEALRHAENLSQLSANAVIQRLNATMVQVSGESDRMLNHIRTRLPAARSESDDTLLGWVAGYPGVLNRWMEVDGAGPPLTGADLQRLAGEAQSLRYTDLQEQLGKLPETQLAMAAAIICLPRLDDESWEIHRTLVCGGQDEPTVDALIDASVFDQQNSVPSYGHETRHAAARRWFIRHRLPLLRRTASSLIRSLASLITGVDDGSFRRLETLAGLGVFVDEVGIEPAATCLVDAALTIFGDYARMHRNAFDRSYQGAVQRTPAAARLIAMALVNRGYENGQRSDFDSAVADFTAAIQLRGSPVDVVANALNGRAYSEGHRRNIDAAIRDFSSAIDLIGAPVDLVCRALLHRGFLRGKLGDSDAEIADYTAAIGLPGATVEQVSTAHFNRGMEHGKRGEVNAQLADFTAAIGVIGAPADLVAKAFYRRGRALEGLGDRNAAVADYYAAVNLPGTSQASAQETHDARVALAAIRSSERSNG